MKIYTRTGDAGQTGLFGGPRVHKDDIRVAAYGELDDANACIGVALAHCRDPELTAILTPIQSELFDVGAVVATPALRLHRRHLRGHRQGRHPRRRGEEG